MSAEDEKVLIEDQENRAQEDDPSDFVLIFKNPYNDPDMGLKCQIDYTMDAQEAKLFYRIIFKLNEREDKAPILKEIEKEIEQLISDNTVDDEINVGILAGSIIKNTFRMLQKHLKLDISLFYSRDRDEIFCRIKSNENNLMVQADLIDYPLQFKKGFLDVQDFKQVSPYGPFESGEQRLLDLFRRYGPDDEEITTGEGSLFQYKDRERLVYELINSSIDLSILRSKGLLTNAMALHRKKQKDILLETWAKNKNPIKRQDIEKIRVYFGEKVAMYFAWIEFLLIVIAPFAAISVILGIMYYVFDDPNDTSDSFSGGEVIIILLAFMLPIMSTFFDQLWQREQCILAWKWGTTKMDTSDEQRPEFKGEYRKDEVTGRMKKCTPESHWTTTRKTIGFSVVMMFVVLVLAAVVVLFVYRATLDQTSWHVSAIGVLNAFQIKFFNIVYSYVAIMLNDWENYETFNDYNDGLTVKLFLFQFVNSYSSLFYIAFAKGEFEGCHDDNCIYELEKQLESIFITNFCLNLVEIYLPMLVTKYNLWSEAKRVKKLKESDDSYRETLGPAEAQSKLSKYDTPLSDYMEIVMLLGYVVIFGCSYPLTVALFFVLLFVETRVDAWKMCTLTQRPFPQRVNSIGVWIQIIQIMSFVGAASSMGIIIFTTNAFELEEGKDQWLAFLVLEHILILLKIILAVIIPNVPSRVTRGLTWSDIVVDERLYGKLTDVDKVRKARNLMFIESPDFKKADINYKNISFSDI